MEITSLDILKVVTAILALLIAVIGHEIAHGYIAYRYGDDTAKVSGRLSINPISHIDPIGSILIPLMLFLMQSPFLFGWAKPVPVDINRVTRNGGAVAGFNVAVAGVVYNLILAIVASLILHQLSQPADLFDGFLYLLIFQLVIINVVLAVFNMWPIPKFDGANALIYIGFMFGSRKLHDFFEKIEKWSLPILLLVLLTPLKEPLFAPALWIWGELLQK
jgi:Zn-dependent protease